MRREFSWPWALVAVGVIIGVELLLGGLIGGWVGGYQSISLRFTLQGLLHLVAYFVGGFVVGVVTPGKRTIEPAVGAFLSVGLMFVLQFFVPYAFISFSLVNVVVGGGIAFALALAGAYLGERITGQLN